MQGAERRLERRVEVACPGCAEIRLERPQFGSATLGLELPLLQGTIQPGVSQATWRVRSRTGDVFDGALPVVNGRYDFARIPLFAGANQLEVLVSGVGSGFGEARCTTLVNSSVAREQGFRGLLTWDGPTSDLDIHVIGPGGTFGDPGTTLTSRSQNPTFGGQVFDDFDGFGPEVAAIDPINDGVYGVIVEPINDADDPGSTAFLRVLYEGRTLTVGPIGPVFLSAEFGELWVAGTFEIRDGQATWQTVGEVVDAGLPPVRPPEAWPELY